MKKKGIISKMYPLTKLIMAIILGATSIIVHQWQFGYFVIFPLMMILSIFDGCFKTYFKKVMSAVIVFFLFIFVVQAFFTPSTNVIWEWKFLVLTVEGLNKALNLTSTILVFLTTLLLVFETSNITDLMVSLQKTGMSNSAAYVFLASLQMIPEMNKRSKIIMQAQRARGIETEGNMFIRIKAFFPTLSPLIISSVTDVADKAVTLEARGFSSNTPNTYYRELNKRLSDKVLFWLVVISCISYISWIYIVPLFGGM